MRGIPNFVMLRAFEAAGRLESFTRAAEELHLTQPAISHQVRGLEEHLGRKLFVRRNRRVQLTAEGRTLLNGISRGLAIIQDTVDEVTDAPDSAILAVHSAPSFATKWLGPMLSDFVRSFPEITIRLSSGADLMNLNRLPETDIVISYGAAHAAEGLVVTPLGEERIVPLCAPGLLATDKSPDEQMQSLTLIDSTLSRVTWSDWFALNGLPFPTRARPSFDRAALAISAAADGMGVALESVRLAERELASGELMEVRAGRCRSIARETHFVSHRQADGDIRKIKVFRDWLLSRAGVEI